LFQSNTSTVHEILLHVRFEKSVCVSSQQSAGKFGMAFSQNSFAISFQNQVAQICG
jgi:hypothetical protein